MGDASLSQEEIDALLMGADEVVEEPVSGSLGDFGDENIGVSSEDYSNLISSFNGAMMAAAKSASSLVTKNINISDLRISDSDPDSAGTEILPNSVIIDINMGSHQTAIVFDETIAKRISMAMMGTTQEPATMDEAHLSTLGELANTILAALSNSLGQKFQDDLTPSTPTAKVYMGMTDLPGFATDRLKKFEYDLEVDTELGRLIQYFDENTVNQWNGSSAEEMPPMRGGGVPDEREQPDLGQMSGGFQMSGRKDYSGGQVNVNPVNYPSLAPSGMKGQMPTNIDILLDVQMVLTVELGRTKKYVKDILSLGEGSIIELDKLAGEPVDLLVNGKLIAKGEVVVIDENFGVRVTDIVGPAERLARMAAE